MNLASIRYKDDPEDKYRRFIFSRLFSSVFRGQLYRMTRLHAKGLISVASGVRILGPRRNLKFGRNCKIEENVLIQSICRQGIILGDEVTLCYGALVRPTGHWGKQLGEGLRMGNRSSVGAYSYVGCAGFIDIGDDVLMGPRVTLIAEGHNFNEPQTTIKEQGVSRKGIRIENNVWIGTNTTILDGVTIGSGSIIAAGAVVNKNVEPKSIVAGVPARLIRKRS
jgi:acetyltransferase-like isoleucine patch superfamily enzyme